MPAQRAREAGGRTQDPRAKQESVAPRSGVFFLQVSFSLAFDRLGRLRVFGEIS